jgi:hypothetical protein
VTEDEGRRCVARARRRKRPRFVVERAEREIGWEVVGI